MRVALLAALGVCMVGLIAHGWSVIPEEGRFPVRWGLFGSRAYVSKRQGLVMWLVLESVVLGPSAVAEDALLPWIGGGLLAFLLVSHFFAIRRARSS